MNTGTDRAGEDDKVDAQLGDRHVTIAVPSTSLP
jgi:hypothetical protein